MRTDRPVVPPSPAAPLEVDGARPAVARVAALPAEWVTTGERLVLLALACDAYDGQTTAPGTANLAAWVGMWPQSVETIVRDLARPQPQPGRNRAPRPALVVRQTTRGGSRRRTMYTLALPADEPPAVPGNVAADEAPTNPRTAPGDVAAEPPSEPPSEPPAEPPASAGPPYPSPSPGEGRASAFADDPPLSDDEAHEVDAALAARRIAEALGVADALTADDRRRLVADLRAVPGDRLPEVVARAVRRRSPRVVDSPAGFALGRVRDACQAAGLVARVGVPA